MARAIPCLLKFASRAIVIPKVSFKALSRAFLTQSSVASDVVFALSVLCATRLSLLSDFLFGGFLRAFARGTEDGSGARCLTTGTGAPFSFVAPVSELQYQLRQCPGGGLLKCRTVVPAMLVIWTLQHETVGPRLTGSSSSLRLRVPPVHQAHFAELTRTS